MLESSKKNTYAVQMVIALCIAIFVPNYSQYQLSPLAIGIMSDYGISSSQFSLLFTAPMIPAITFSFVIGMLMDKFNSKLIVGFSLICTIAGAILEVLASSFAILFIALMLIGVSVATINCSMAKIVSGYYSPEKVSEKTGIILSASTIGMTIAVGTTALFTSRRAAFMFNVILTILAIVSWTLMYHTPESTRMNENNLQSDRKNLNLKKSLGTVIKNRHVWIVSICLALLMGANVVMSSFTPTLLAERNIDSVQAGYYTSAYTIGCLASCYIAPAIVRKTKRYRLTCGCFAAIAFIGVAFAVPNVPAGILLLISIFITGTCVGANLPLFVSLPVNLRDIGPEFAGTAGGFVSTIELVGAVIIPSYILIPISGEGNLEGLYLLAGVCMAMCCILTQFLPQNI